MDYLDFNTLSQIEFPQIFLCHKNTILKKGIKFIQKYGELYPIQDLKMTMNLNAPDEVFFSVPKESNGVINPFWNQLVDLKIIQIPKFGNYEITVQRVDDGTTEIKNISGKSLEIELGQIGLYDFEINTLDQIKADESYQTIYFYRPTDPNHSMLHLALLKVPAWNIGHIDNVLWDKVRTFDINGSSIYDFLTGDVAKELECLFLFDTFNRTVNCYDLKKYGSDTTIYLSKENLVSEINVEADTGQIKNCFKVSGGDGVTIASVNPNGTDYIWMLTEYDKADMSKELKGKLESYNVLYAQYTQSYENIMKQLQSIFIELSNLTHKISSSINPYTDLQNCGLVQLKELLSSFQGIEDTYISMGYGSSSHEFYQTLYKPNHIKIETVKKQIQQREKEIEAKNTQYNTILLERNKIQEILNLENYLTVNGNKSLWYELSLYRREDTYENTNFAATDNSTAEELFEIERALYDEAVKELAKANTPQYQFSVHMDNLLANSKFVGQGIEQFKLGNFIRVGINDNEIAKVRLISITLDFNNLQNISVDFSDTIYQNGMLLDAQSILNQATNAATSYDTVKRQYESTKDKINFVTQIKQEGLNAALVPITNADNQSIILDEHGLLCRLYNEQKLDYELEQLKIINNLICYTDDNWQSVRMAIGKSTFQGESVYGVWADVIVGNLVAGNNLIISNSSNSFVVDDSGATLKDAKLTIQKDDTIIQLNPEHGFKIESNGETKVSIDKYGQLILRGDGAGLDISSNGTVIGINGDIVKLDTNLKLTNEAIVLEANRATEAEGNLSGRIDITAKNISLEVKRATEVEGNLSSRIDITEEQIQLKVTKGTISSSLSLEPDQIRLTSNRLIVDSTNFKLDENGNATFSGDITGAKITGSSFFIDDPERIVSITKSGIVLTQKAGSFLIELKNQDGQKMWLTNNSISFSNSSSAATQTYLSDDRLVTSMIFCNSINGSPPITIKNVPKYTTDLYGSSGASAGQIAFSNVNAVGWDYAHRTFEISSDLRLKYDIQPLDNITDFYMNLKPKTFRFKDGFDNHKMNTGLIAQQVLQNIKNHNISSDNGLVYLADNVFNQGYYCKNGKHYNINYNDFHAYHIKMIQTQQIEIRKIQEKLNQLEQKIKEILCK